jgi:CRISPR/Cas system CMR-associated protein Cmr1 (group 7 of RAMP superfamily)
MAKDCFQKKRTAVNIMDAKEDPLDYPVAQPKCTSQRINQIKHQIDNLSEGNYQTLRETFAEDSDFQSA